MTASLDDLRTSTVAAFCRLTELDGCVWVASDDATVDDESIAVTSTTREPTGEARGLVARLDVLTDAIGHEVDVLLLGAGAHAAFTPVASVFQSPAGHESGEITIDSFAYRDVLPGDPVEAVLVVRETRDEQDQPTCWEATNENDRLVVCSVVDDAPRCIAIPFAVSRVAGIDEEAGCDDADRDPDEPDEDRGFEVEARIDGSNVVVSAGGDTFGTAVTPPVDVGTHALADLFTTPSLAIALEH